MLIVNEDRLLKRENSARFRWHRITRSIPQLRCHKIKTIKEPNKSNFRIRLSKCRLLSNGITRKCLISLLVHERQADRTRNTIEIEGSNKRQWQEYSELLIEGPSDREDVVRGGQMPGRV